MALRALNAFSAWAGSWNRVTTAIGAIVDILEVAYYAVKLGIYEFLL
jgi:hypothetical protein